MKKALIIHGWDGNPNEPLHEYLKKELTLLGYEVVTPAMPNPAVPIIADWLDKVKSVFDQDFDLLIGHSIGCQAVLRFVETLNLENKIPKMVLIAPWMKLDMRTIEEEGEDVVDVAKPWTETPIDFEKIKNQVESITTIFSDNDPYVPLDQADFFKEELGAQVFIEKGQGHFTESDAFEKLQTETKSII